MFMQTILLLFVIISGVCSQDLDVFGLSLGQGEISNFVLDYTKETETANEKLDILNDAETNGAINENFDDEIIEKICKNNNIIIYDRLSNEKIDCRKFLEPSERIIKKRDVGSELEGSGDDGIKDQVLHQEVEEKNKKTTAEKDIETTTEKNIETTILAHIEATITPLVTSRNPIKITDEEANTTVTALEKDTNIEAETEETQTTTAAPETEETQTTTAAPETEQPQITKDKTEKQLTIAETTRNDTATVSKEFNDFIKKGRRIEDVNEFQGNGVAISNSPGNVEDGISETGPKLQKSSVLKSEETSKNNAEDSDNTPKVGAASAAKDSNILLFLLGGVVAVGVAAFAYNYMKKRKINQQSSETTVEAQLPKEEKREQEMKPLLNGKNVENHPTIAIEDETKNEEPGTSAKC